MIVLDSSFLIAFYNEKDVHHPPALETMKQITQEKWGGVILPEYVFVEVMTVVMIKKNLLSAVSLGTSLLEAKEVEFVPGSDFFSQAFEIFRNQRKPKLSFVDAAIVAIAKKYKTEFVATFDTDFENIDGLKIIP